MERKPASVPIEVPGRTAEVVLWAVDLAFPEQ